MTIMTGGPLILGMLMPVAIAWMIFKERRMSVRDGIAVVVATEVIVYGLAVPHTVSPWFAVFCTVVMWSILSRNTAVNMSRRLGERLKKNGARTPPAKRAP